MAHADLTTYATEVLGPHRVEKVHRATATTAVHEVVDTRGTHWFVKSVQRPRKLRQELEALRTWVPALGDRAPRLVHADESRQACVTSAVPGRPADVYSTTCHEAAGGLLGMIHGRETDLGGNAWRTWSRVTRRRAERALETCRRLQVDVRDDVVRRCLDGIAELDPLPVVPCHGDYLPTNWLVDGGVLRLVDFGEAGPRPRGAAFARLHVGAWWERPDLASAFREGYGDALTQAEERLVDLHRGISALLLLRWGATRGQNDIVRRAQQCLAALGDAPEHPVLT